jgi:hypothetical protein
VTPIYLTLGLSRVFEEGRREDESVEQNPRQQAERYLLWRPTKMSLRPLCSPKPGATETGEDHQFYEDYRKVAEQYDKAFLDKRDEDLNATLIFVSVPSFF